MAYIDRDKLISEIASISGNLNTRNVGEAISRVPTADVVEQKKGKWIIKDNPGTGWYRVTCSECGEDVTSMIPVIGFFPNAKPTWNFCPDCGADMREESDNG